MKANVYTDGHYLNLPVMSDAGEIVGMVDVLKLTYATLDQVRLLCICCGPILITSRLTTSAHQTVKVRPGTSFGSLWMPRPSL
jgi:hypothetical protein